MCRLKMIAYLWLYDEELSHTHVESAVKNEQQLPQRDDHYHRHISISLNMFVSREFIYLPSVKRAFRPTVGDSISQTERNQLGEL